MRVWLKVGCWALNLLCVGLYVLCFWLVVQVGYKGLGPYIFTVCHLIYGFRLLRNYLVEVSREHSHRCRETQRSA